MDAEQERHPHDTFMLSIEYIPVEAAGEDKSEQEQPPYDPEISTRLG